MHGQIGQPDRHVEPRRDSRFDYRNRASMLETYRRLGNGTIDYDFYCRRARAMRGRALRKFLRRLVRFMRSLSPS